MARSRCCYVDTPSGTERSPLILSGWQRAIGADSGQTEHSIVFWQDSRTATRDQCAVRRRSGTWRALHLTD